MVGIDRDCNRQYICEEQRVLSVPKSINRVALRDVIKRAVHLALDGNTPDAWDIITDMVIVELMAQGVALSPLDRATDR
jgi:hypothetical protein